ncbi:CobW family GTP-binding protein [Peptostreptococcus stomatis]|nr:GTP-binding protein [uncultured Peptostreptococcus sp.]
MKKTKINIVSGFLGSGKTTFIKKLIKEADDFSKTVIIENEFGEVSIDGAILEREGLSVREINAGCICCSVAGDFASSINNIKKAFDPDKILIEPSGVGKLSDIKAICLKYPDLFEINRSITIIDASKYSMYKVNFGDFYLDQIKNSDTIIFSRYNQAKEAGIDIGQIIADIKEENDQVQVIDSEWDGFRATDLLESKILESRESRLKTAQDRLGLFNSNGHHHGTNTGDDHSHDGSSCHDHHHDSADEFTSLTLTVNRTFSREDIQALLEAFDTGLYGTIIRAKGSLPGQVKALEFDYVPQEISIRDLDQENDHHVVVIGKDLNSEALLKVF